MERRTRTVAWFVIATTILLGLVYVSDHREILLVIAASDLGYVAVATACGCFTLVMWAIVWHRLFALLDVRVSFLQSLRLLLAGTFLNSVTPLGRFGGEPVIAHLISRRTDATFEQAFSSVSSADLSNAFPFVTFGALAIAYVAVVGTFQQLVDDLVAMIGTLILVSLLVVYLLWFGGAQRLVTSLKVGPPVGRRFGRWQPYVNSGLARLNETLGRMRAIGDHPREMAVTLVVSHVAVLGHLGAMYFVMLSVGVEPVPQTIAIVVALSSFLTFSPTPGSMGAFEAGFAALVVAFFPVTAPTATSIAILYRVATYLPGLVLGYGSLVLLGHRSPRRRPS